MSTDISLLFQACSLGRLQAPNRFVRSATYEGQGAPDGTPRATLGELYTRLAEGGVGTIITGFTFVSQAGRAMQPRQCGIDSDAKTGAWQQVVHHVRDHAPEVRLVMQLVHAGRQTRRTATGLPVVGASTRPCSYFREPVTPLTDEGVGAIVADFAGAAHRAGEAGFDAVQVHAAHGYLHHQFLSPWTNTRTDRWQERPLFLEETLRAIRARCGPRFPILVKLSAADDTAPGVRLEDTVATAKRLAAVGVDAIEVSYGTMEHALNIMRGECPVDVALAVNPMLSGVPRFLRGVWKRFLFPSYHRRIIPFSEGYTVAAASQIAAATKVPVFPVGGIRSVDQMAACVRDHGLAAVGLCRTLICEPDLPSRLRAGACTSARCCNCNLCTVYCDTPRPTRCYYRVPLAECGI
jgi:2,4-dienoyl-CoA reductase-like NADH-dependent reductase (Old Yellow Enzyme family)